MWDNACSWTRTRLPLMAGGELTGTDRRKTERHLIGCRDCRDRLESAKGTVDLLRSIGSETGPAPDTPSLWPALARQIRETRREQPVTSIWELRPPAWVGAAMAAGLLLAAGASWTLSPSRGVAMATPESPAVRATELATRPDPPKPKPKTETGTLAEGPRPADDRLTSEPSGKAVRPAPSPANPARPPVEATH